MVSQYVYDLCHAGATVSSELAKNPRDTPEKIIQRLYGSQKPHTPHRQSNSSSDNDDKEDASRDALQRAYECGQWPHDKPSRLFLRAFADSLACLDANPLAGMVSPPLMGSHGVVPLTIIAPLVSLMHHCANLIRKARKEVFFITCTWKASIAQRLIRDALVDLSKRAGLRGERVMVRIMFDQPGVWHALDSHQPVKSSTYDSKHVQLPFPHEIPNLDLEVIGAHTIFLGTLHSKLLIVDGLAAAVMSNNVEDNANVEMLTHLEGPIVASIYDTALITWRKNLKERPSTIGQAQTTDKDVEAGVTHPENLEAGNLEDPHYDSDLKEEMAYANQGYDASEKVSRLEAVNHQLNLPIKNHIQASGPEIANGREMTPYFTTMTSQPVPMALVSRPPYGPLDAGNTYVPQNEAWLSLVRNAKRSIFIQTPDLNADSLLKALAEAVKRGVEVTYYVCFGYNDAGEMIPGQGGTNEQAARRLIAMLDGDKQALQLLHIYNYVAKDQDHPIHHSFKSRSCHIKLMIADETVGIQGSGNQDTQSWCHSQEVNVMVDSPEVCAQWRWGIEQNQNTRAFGRVSADGVWKDANGVHGEGYSGDPGMVDGLVRGVVGMVKKAMA
ncbi:unnamed protein product [Clonostachys byssicola]|uniref:PLD phosphodiesterase domain-containing protein n=1 Tax=Clonostachys byssicola TaxID=160290 RepID=A0A9N9UD99_9HYPO|nr:unnamed protein product [Clonostachys byssicola]